MLGNLYDRALDGERCWVRHDDGEVRHLPVRSGSAAGTPTTSSTAPCWSCARARRSTWVAAQGVW